MKIYNFFSSLFFVTSVTLLFSASNSFVYENDKLIGIWEHKSEISYLSDDGVLEPITIYLEFRKDNLYFVSSKNIPQNFPLLFEPNFSGSWEINNENKIKLFQTPIEISFDNDIFYFFEINEITDKILDVNITDKNGKLINKIVFAKKKD